MKICKQFKEKFYSHLSNNQIAIFASASNFKGEKTTEIICPKNKQIKPFIIFNN